MPYLYLLINLGSFVVPFLFSFHPKLNFYRQWRYAWPAILLAAAVFICWDFYYTHLGVWGFNPRYILGIYVGNLPLEEIMFFICIPYSCVFTYHCFKVLIKKDYFQKYENTITLSLLLFLITVGGYNYDKLYTGVTFMALAAFILFLKYYLKVRWLSRFYFAYLILLIPFLIDNGILTGSGLDQPVVWYNNTENLGIRLLTIPVEDIFYGMLLIMLCVAVSEWRPKSSS